MPFIYLLIYHIKMNGILLVIHDGFYYVYLLFLFIKSIMVFLNISLYYYQMIGYLISILSEVIC